VQLFDRADDTVHAGPGWTAGKTGTGNGSVSYAVTANTKNKARTGQLTIGGQTFEVTQNGSN